MIRVGFDATLLGGRTTGAGEYQRQLLRCLARRPGDVTVVAYRARGSSRVPVEGLEDREMPWSAGDRVRRILQGGLLWGRRWRRDRLDLLHVPFYYLPPGSPARSIVTVFDVRFARWPESYRRARGAFLRLAVPWSLRRAAHVITISEFTRRELVELLGLAPAKISVTRLASRPGLRRIEDEDALVRVRAKYGLPERFVLATGALEPRKNLVRVVEAMGRLRARGGSHRLVLAGIPDFGTPEVHAAIARQRLADAVHLTGYVDDADMAALYTLADVFVYASLYEGFGIPPLEAMACGTPVVASDRTSVPEVVGEAARLVDPEDVEAIASGIASTIEDRALSARLRAAGLARAAEFSWERTASETVAVYRRVHGGTAWA